MDDAKNFVMGLLQTARDRFGNPFISAFAFAWFAWNFRLILVIVGDGSGGWEAKIKYIDSKLMVHWYDWLIHGYVVPSAFALFWIFAMPPVLRKFAARHEQNVSRTRDEIFSYTNQQTLTPDEALTLRSTMVRQRADWQTEKAAIVTSLETIVSTDQAKDTRIQQLSNEVTGLKSEIEQLKAPPPQKPFEFVGKATQEKAEQLGIRLVGASSPSAFVTFDNAMVDWPWRPTENQKINIPHSQLINEPLYQAVLQGVLVLTSPSSTLIHGTEEEVIKHLSRHKVQMARETFMHLRQLAVFQANRGQFTLSQAGHSLSRWLREVGFRLSGETQ